LKSEFPKEDVIYPKEGSFAMLFPKEVVLQLQTQKMKKYPKYACVSATFPKVLITGTFGIKSLDNLSFQKVN